MTLTPADLKRLRENRSDPRTGKPIADRPKTKPRKKRTQLEILIIRCQRCVYGRETQCEMSVKVNAGTLETGQELKDFGCNVIKEVKKRYKKCQECEHSLENGDSCALRAGCCFGSWMANPQNECPDNPPRWEKMLGTEQASKET